MKTISLKGSNFLFKEVRKSVEVSINGHGVAQYELTMTRKNSKERYICHQIGGEESIPSNIKLMSLKTGFKAWEAGDIRQVTQGYTFAIGALKSKTNELIWKELAASDREKSFKIDLKRTFGTDPDVFYGYGWSSPCMFKDNKAKELRSSIKIVRPTEQLALSVTFEEKYPLQKGPTLAVYDEKGRKQSCPDVYQYRDLFGKTFDMRIMHTFGELFEVVIMNPKVGWTYETVWKIQ